MPTPYGPSPAKQKVRGEELAWCVRQVCKHGCAAALSWLNPTNAFTHLDAHTCCEVMRKRPNGVLPSWHEPAVPFAHAICSYSCSAAAQQAAAPTLNDCRHHCCRKCRLLLTANGWADFDGTLTRQRRRAHLATETLSQPTTLDAHASFRESVPDFPLLNYLLNGYSIRSKGSTAHLRAKLRSLYPLGV